MQLVFSMQVGMLAPQKILKLASLRIFSQSFSDIGTERLEELTNHTALDAEMEAVHVLNYISCIDII